MLTRFPDDSHGRAPDATDLAALSHRGGTADAIRAKPGAARLPRRRVVRVESNSGSTIAYGKYYREHRPISTTMAESAVNQVINARMCKHQHMRWTPRGAHLLAQVRCTVIHGDLAAKLAALRACMNEILEDVARSLEFMQQAEEAEPHAF